MNGTFLGEMKLEPNKYYQWLPSVPARFGPFTLTLVDNRPATPSPVAVPEKSPAPLPAPPPLPLPHPSTSPSNNVRPSIGTTQVSVRHFLVCPEGIPNKIMIAAEPILIGRAPDCTMVLDGPRTSRHHCKVQRRGNLIEVIDLNSTNGTFLQNRRLPANSPTLWDGTSPLVVGSFAVALESEHGPGR